MNQRYFGANPWPNEPTVASLVTEAEDLATLQREREDVAPAVNALEAR